MKIWRRPRKSGSPTSTCSSSRPGRNTAGSSRSRLFVMPTTSTLSRLCIPSSFVSSWFTTLSCTTDAVAPPEPRAFMMASISSKMMTCRRLLSPFPLNSFSAGANRSRMFSSDCPTNLCRISGPFTILGGCALSNLPSCFATRVFPVPGGPYSNMPFTCRMPSFWTTSGATIRLANTRRKMVRNSSSRPPTPYFSKLPSLSMSCRCFWLAPAAESCESLRSGGSGIRFRFPAGPARAPSDPVTFAAPDAGAFTTVGFALGFSCGVRTAASRPPPTPTPIGAPKTAAGRWSGFAAGFPEPAWFFSGPEATSDAPDARRSPAAPPASLPAAMASASASISLRAASRASAARCASSSPSRGDLVLMSRAPRARSADKWVTRGAEPRRRSPPADAGPAGAPPPVSATRARTAPRRAKAPSARRRAW